MADDDRNEQLLMVLAAEEADVHAELTFVDDGTQLLMHLNRRLEEQMLPDLILLDLRMPVLDGHRTLRQLKAHPVLWQIPVVAFSSSTRKEDRDQCLENGAGWFETKPSEYAEMIRFIESLPARAADAETYQSDVNEQTNTSELVIDGLGFDLDEIEINLTEMDD